MTHSETTRRTRAALASALKRQACQRPFSKITVSDLIAECKVNRKTFYYHFQDIYDLLQWLLEQETFVLLQKFDLLAEAEEALNFFLDYLDDNDAFLKSVYHSLGQSELKRFFYNDFLDMMRAVTEETAQAENLTVSEDYLRFSSSFYAEAVAGTLCMRMESPFPLTREQVLRYTLVLIQVSIPSALKAAADAGY